MTPKRVLAICGVAAVWFCAAAAQAQNPCDPDNHLTRVSLEAPPNLTMPADFITTSQANADCVAWQEFLYLNWAANPTVPGQPDPNATVADFGKSGSTAATVWESFLEASQVFAPSNTAAQGERSAAWFSRRPPVKQLRRLSKLGAATISLGSVRQAGSDGWLTDQAGNLVFYEVLLNQDEYNYISSNGLTTFAGQAACASSKGIDGHGGLSLPAGGGMTGKNADYDCLGASATYGENMGAIEIKAAWRVLPADGSLNGRYKISSAALQLPDGTTQQATVGLIGLHILHKLPNAPQFVWATFEQIDNDPDAGDPPTAPVLPAGAPALAPYALFNPKCDPSTDTVYACDQNTTLVADPPPTTPLPACKAGTYTSGTCYPYWAPMQIVRTVPVSPAANAVTSYAWTQMPDHSVFKYYRLINVQWPDDAASVPPGSLVPLSAGGITPPSSSGILANTTTETFMQSSASCMDCHQHAGTAQASGQSFATSAGRSVRSVQVTPQLPFGQSPAYASDYSFLFATETTH